MQRNSPVKLAIISLLLAATAAQAQSGTVGPNTIPGDTREEKLTHIKAALTRMDINNDKRVTKTEWLAAGGKRVGFETLDYNRDDIMTVQELRSNARKLRAFADFKAAAPY